MDVRVSYVQCTGPAPNGPDAGDAGVGVRGFHLAGGQAETADLRVHGETLFLDHTDPDLGALRFADVASADDRYGNGDGDVTLSELGLVPISDLGMGVLYVEFGDASTIALTTLEDLVYLGLVPHVARFEDRGSCGTHTRR